MAGIYGSFFDESNELHDKFFSRLDSLTFIAEYCVKDTVSKRPALDSVLKVSYINVYLTTGKYFNDVSRLKALHNMGLLHRSKIVSHLVKWMNLNPILISCADRDDLKKLTNEDKLILINANYIVMSCILTYVLKDCSNIFSDSGTDRDRIKFIAELQYYLKTGSYDEHIANLLFRHI